MRLLVSALLTLLPLHGRWAVRLGRALAALPAVLFAGYWAVAAAAGEVWVWPAQPGRLVLLAAGIALAVTLVGRSADRSADG